MKEHAWTDLMPYALSWVVALWVALWITSAPAAAICAYAPEKSYRPALWDSVFLGRVLAAETRFDSTLPERIFGPDAAVQVVRFELLAGWKGTSPETAHVAVLSMRSEEAPVYRPGSMYVVWAHRLSRLEGTPQGTEEMDPLIGATCLPDDYCADPTPDRLGVVRRLGQPEWFRGPPPAERCGWRVLGLRRDGREVFSRPVGWRASGGGRSRQGG